MYPDFLDLLVQLNRESVQYAVVGGYAVNVHGFTRVTGDLDVFVGRDEGNLRRLIRAMDQYGCPPGLTLDALSVVEAPPSGFMFGRPPFRIDLLTSITGLSFEEALESAADHSVRGVEVTVIGLDALLKSKRASGRPRDLIDVAELEALHRSER